MRVISLLKAMVVEATVLVGFQVRLAKTPGVSTYLKAWGPALTQRA
jgi:hypothetical protein